MTKADRVEFVDVMAHDLLRHLNELQVAAVGAIPSSSDGAATVKAMFSLLDTRLRAWSMLWRQEASAFVPFKSVLADNALDDLTRAIHDVTLVYGSGTKIIEVKHTTVGQERLSIEPSSFALALREALRYVITYSRGTGPILVEAALGLGDSSTVRIAACAADDADNHALLSRIPDPFATTVTGVEFGLMRARYILEMWDGSLTRDTDETGATTNLTLRIPNGRRTGGS
jgi:hypothetical protein